MFYLLLFVSTKRKWTIILKKVRWVSTLVKVNWPPGMWLAKSKLMTINHPLFLLGVTLLRQNDWADLAIAYTYLVCIRLRWGHRTWTWSTEDIRSKNSAGHAEVSVGMTEAANCDFMGLDTNDTFSLQSYSNRKVEFVSFIYAGVVSLWTILGCSEIAGLEKFGKFSEFCGYWQMN